MEKETWTIRGPSLNLEDHSSENEMKRSEITLLFHASKPELALDLEAGESRALVWQISFVSIPCVCSFSCIANKLSLTGMVESAR
ncbi:hypothetical protein AAK899_12510 [Erysipelotrichaceae bacterium 51-3]